MPPTRRVFEDRTVELRLRTPPTAFLIRRALDGKGSARPGHEPAATLTRDALRAIAVRKLPDLNTVDVEAAMRTVAGTARAMGVAVSPLTGRGDVVPVRGGPARLGSGP